MAFTKQELEELKTHIKNVNKGIIFSVIGSILNLWDIFKVLKLEEIIAVEVLLEQGARNERAYLKTDRETADIVREYVRNLSDEELKTYSVPSKEFIESVQKTLISLTGMAGMKAKPKGEMN